MPATLVWNHQVYTIKFLNICNKTINGNLQSINKYPQDLFYPINQSEIGLKQSNIWSG